ncbi:MAG: hypothetical protein JSU95_04000 [Betaproteobacteria bacterium]|nr:MAG: hypothetical protein JSU95_04000 [Betaproteobacteria bacterium]
MVDHEDYRNHGEARQSLFEYIEIFYNRQRRHSHLENTRVRSRNIALTLPGPPDTPA